MTEETVKETEVIEVVKEEKATVPMRKLEVYQTDDGRRVEVFPIVGSVELDTANDEEAAGQSFSSETIYVGVVHIPSPSGPQEIKFEIPGVDTPQAAFDKYYDFASKAVDEIRKRMIQRQEEADKKIVTAPAEALKALDQGEGNIIL
jgi:hypothetical protein